MFKKYFIFIFKFQLLLNLARLFAGSIVFEFVGDIGSLVVVVVVSFILTIVVWFVGDCDNNDSNVDAFIGILLLSFEEWLLLSDFKFINFVQFILLAEVNVLCGCNSLSSSSESSS